MEEVDKILVQAISENTNDYTTAFQRLYESTKLPLSRLTNIDKLITDYLNNAFEEVYSNLSPTEKNRYLDEIDTKIQTIETELWKKKATLQSLKSSPLTTHIAINQNTIIAIDEMLSKIDKTLNDIDNIKNDLDNLRMAIETYKNEGLSKGIILENTKTIYQGSDRNTATNKLLAEMNGIGDADDENPGLASGPITIIPKNEEITVFKMEVTVGKNTFVNGAIRVIAKDDAGQIANVKTNLVLNNELRSQLDKYPNDIPIEVTEMVAENVKRHLESLDDNLRSKPIDLVTNGNPPMHPNVAKAFIIYCAHKNIRLKVPAEYVDYQTTVSEKSFNTPFTTPSQPSIVNEFAKKWEEKHPGDLGNTEEQTLEKMELTETIEPPRPGRR